jgi:hypothetical protein
MCEFSPSQSSQTEDFPPIWSGTPVAYLSMSRVRFWVEPLDPADRPGIAPERPPGRSVAAWEVGQRPANRARRSLGQLKVPGRSRISGHVARSAGGGDEMLHDLVSPGSDHRGPVVVWDGVGERGFALRSAREFSRWAGLPECSESRRTAVHRI